jgi:hypothetical protein
MSDRCHKGSRTPQNTSISLNSSRLRDLSAARLERKQTLSQSSSSEALETASKVRNVASAWSLMKQKYRERGSSSAQSSLTETELSSRLVHVIKATSKPAQATVRGSKLLFKKKAGSPGRSVTPRQPDLLSKVQHCTDSLAKKARPVIEVALFPVPQPPPKRKPKLIEVSMT